MCEGGSGDGAAFAYDGSPLESGSRKSYCLSQLSGVYNHLTRETEIALGRRNIDDRAAGKMERLLPEGRAR